MPRHESLESFELFSELTARGKLHNVACRRQRLDLLTMVPRFGGGLFRRFRITTDVGKNPKSREMERVGLQLLNITAIGPACRGFTRYRFWSFWRFDKALRQR